MAPFVLDARAARQGVTGLHRALLCLLAAPVLACGGATTRAAPALLHVTCAPAQCVVHVDDQAVGTADSGGGAVVLRPGIRRVEVTAPGYLPYRADVEVVGGAEYELAIELWPEIEELDE